MLAKARHHCFCFKEMVRHLTQHRRLCWELVKRDVSDRFTGQVLGRWWSIVHPLALMGIYIFIFAYVFKIKIGGTREMPRDYTTYLLSGLIPWLVFAESMAKGVSAITGNASLVKQVVFPIEMLPLKGIIASMLTQVVATTILGAYLLLAQGSLPWTFALVPLLMFFQFLAMGGICFILSAISPYFRDLKDIVQIFLVMGLYLMPAFFLPQWVPGLLRPLLYFNPFSYMIWCYQDACYFGRFDHPWAWPVFTLGSVFLFYFGYRCFTRLKICFGSAL